MRRFASFPGGGQRRDEEDVSRQRIRNGRTGNVRSLILSFQRASPDARTRSSQGSRVMANARQIGGKGMLSRTANRFPLALLALVGMTILIPMGRAQKAGAAFTPVIPKTWDDEAVAALDVPLADARYSPVQISSDKYYQMTVRPVY